MPKELYINPESMTKVAMNKLPPIYKERMQSRIRVATVKVKTEKQRLLTETKEGEKLFQNIRPKEAKGFEFKINKKYDPSKPWKTVYGHQIQIGTKPDSPEFNKKKCVPIYTEAFARVHGTVKFELVKKFEQELPSIRDSYNRDMTSKDTRTAMIATMVAITDESPIRSGNLKSATRKVRKTYGISTLLARHFTKDKDKNQYIIRFSGKDSMENEKYIKNPATVKQLDKILRGKDRNDYVFSIDGKKIGQQELSDYLKKVGGSKSIKYHFFRHIHATRVFKEMMDKYIESGVLPDMPTQKELSRVVKKASDVASKLLGNKQAACIKSYILPQIIFDYYKKYNLEVPDIYKNLVFNDPRLSNEDISKMANKKWNTKVDEADDDTGDEEENLADNEENNENTDDNKEDDEEDDVVYEDDGTDDEVKNKEDDGEDDVIYEDAGTEDEVNSSTEEDVSIFGENTDTNIDSIKPDSEKDLTYEERLKLRMDFEDYLLTYEYDEDDIFINPAVLGEVLIKPDFIPDFSGIVTYERPNYYAEVNRSKDYDIRKDGVKFGYNDQGSTDVSSIRKEMEDKVKEYLEDLIQRNKEINR